MSNTVEAHPDVKKCPACRALLRVDAGVCSDCGITLMVLTETAKPELLIGQTLLDTYRIMELLGVGSMGAVYRAVDLSLSREVAFKVILDNLDDDTNRARFRREARAATQLAHPNVVQVFDFGTLERGQPYLVMELLNGQTLEEIIAVEGRVDLPRAGGFLLDVLSALEAAHEFGILHRDLKPANVLVTRKASPYGGSPGEELAKVLDFGIATAIGGSRNKSDTWAPLTEAGFVCGTPAFMSPEQVQGFQLDQRSDLFSAASLFYQLLTGLRPFEGKSPVEVGANIVLKPLLPPGVRVPDLELPPSIDDFVMIAMAKKPERRFDNAHDMADTLRKHLETAMIVFESRPTTEIKRIDVKQSATVRFPRVNTVRTSGKIDRERQHPADGDAVNPAGRSRAQTATRASATHRRESAARPTPAMASVWLKKVPSSMFEPRKPIREDEKTEIVPRIRASGRPAVNSTQIVLTAGILVITILIILALTGLL